MPFHGTGETLTDRGRGNVNFLTGNEMLGRDLGTNINQVVGGNPELDELAFRFDLSLGEMSAHGLANAFHLGLTNTELQCGVAVPILGTLGDNLTVIDLQHCDGNVLTGVIKDTGHSHFLCNYSGAYHLFSPALEFDLDVHTGRQVELHKRINRLRGGVDDVQEPLVGANLKLLAALLVDMR